MLIVFASQFSNTNIMFVLHWHGIIYGYSLKCFGFVPLLFQDDSTKGVYVLLLSASPSLEFPRRLQLETAEYCNCTTICVNGINIYEWGTGYSFSKVTVLVEFHTLYRQWSSTFWYFDTKKEHIFKAFQDFCKLLEQINNFFFQITLSMISSKC